MLPFCLPSCASLIAEVRPRNDGKFAPSSMSLRCSSRWSFKSEERAKNLSQHFIGLAIGSSNSTNLGNSASNSHLNHTHHRIKTLQHHTSLTKTAKSSATFTHRITKSQMRTGVLRRYQALSLRFNEPLFQILFNGQQKHFILRNKSARTMLNRATRSECTSQVTLVTVRSLDSFIQTRGFLADGCVDAD